MKKTTKGVILDYFGITIGSALIALGLTLFLIPNRIAPGGISGLATVLFYLTGFPVGITVLIINIPLFLIGLKYLGGSVGIRTIYGIITLSFFIEVFQALVPVLTTDSLLAAVYGGIMTGIGLGVVFNAKGTTGGTDMIARLINNFTELSIGKGLLIADGFVIFLAGIFFNLELALYASFAIVINSKAIDIFQEGLHISKGAFIISPKHQEITEKIISNLDRGITGLKGYGGYTAKDKDVLLCIIARSEVSRLKKLVYNLDPQAFVIITNVHEVLGEGFKEIKT